MGRVLASPLLLSSKRKLKHEIIKQPILIAYFAITHDTVNHIQLSLKLNLARFFSCIPWIGPSHLEVY